MNFKLDKLFSTLIEMLDRIIYLILLELLSVDFFISILWIL